MGSKILIFAALALIAASAEGFRNFPGFGSGFPFGGGSPMDFVAAHVNLPNNWFQNSFPEIPPVKIPSKDDIINFNPKPGQNYHGMFMESNGDESKLVVNNNGDVYVHKIPNSVDEPERTKPAFEIPKPSISFDNLFNVPDPINVRSFVSSPNTKGHAKVVSTFSSYSNDNGKESHSGSIYSLDNDGKNVKETSIKF